MDAKQALATVTRTEFNELLASRLLDPPAAERIVETLALGFAVLLNAFAGTEDNPQPYHPNDFKPEPDFTEWTTDPDAQQAAADAEVQRLRN